jgi:hypothetical protein
MQTVKEFVDKAFDLFKKVKKVKSLTQGQKCNTDSDCPASDGLTSAKCRCGFNSNGTKYCDILPGDSEWVITRAAVHCINFT